MILCLNRHTQSAQHPHNPRWQHQAALQGRPQGTVRSLSPLRPSHPRQRSKGTAGTHRATQGNSSSQQPHKGNGTRQVCRPRNAGAHRHTRTQGHTDRARTATPTLRAPAGAHRRRRARTHGHGRSGSERRRPVRRKRKRRSRRKRKGERRGVPQLPGSPGRSLGCFGGPGPAVRLHSAPFGPARPAGKRGSQGATGTRSDLRDTQSREGGHDRARSHPHVQPFCPLYRRGTHGMPSLSRDRCPAWEARRLPRFPVCPELPLLRAPTQRSQAALPTQGRAERTRRNTRVFAVLGKEKPFHKKGVVFFQTAKARFVRSK